MAQLILGNTAARHDEKQVDWVFYVRGATQYVKRVVVKLHPTFRNPVRTLLEEPFDLKGRGWGTFDLDVTIFWKTGEEHRCTWALQFQQADACAPMAVPPEVVAALGPAPPPAERPPSGRRLSQTPAAPAEPLAEPDPEDSDGSDDSAPCPSIDLIRAASAGQPPDGVGRPAEVEAEEAATAASSAAPPPPKQPAVDAEQARQAICRRLVQAGYLRPTDPRFMHGRAYDGPALAPRCTWKCAKPPRDDHEAPEWLTASEFQDEAQVLEAKCRQLAELMRLSRKTVAYTGAGISAAVIGQAARSGQNKVGWKPDTRLAKPTFTHFALGFLGQNGLINSWVQQNHDGLPQKAGFPQENINEIHGSWYDPSNPVVKYSGSLHDRAFPWMENDAATADLVLVLGTSLGGLNADQVVTRTADRSREANGALGAVCMNLQQTEQDGKMTLRFFGKSDDVLRVLLRELGFGKMKMELPKWPKESRALVPYDADGRRLGPGGGRRMWLDLRDGQKVRITPGHNIQGARQPAYMHIGAKKPVTVLGETRQPAVGNGTVVRREEESASFILDIEGASMRLGIWWLDCATRGSVEALPIVNRSPAFE